MQRCFVKPGSASGIPVHVVVTGQFTVWLGEQSQSLKNWVSSNDFTGKAGSHIVVPGNEGRLAAVVVVVASDDDFWPIAGLAAQLPGGDYQLTHRWGADRLQRASIGWGLGSYVFNRYKDIAESKARLILDAAVDTEEVDRVVAASTLARNLINTPAHDMMPEHLAEQVSLLAETYGATFEQIVGGELLERNYPAIHSVGRASRHAPRLLDLRWGNPSDPRITLVGKGVCFDSGGLDIKPATGMRLMKKDMGGGAHAIALARLVMDAGLKVRLRLLVPAVENAIDGDAYRPGDIITTRSGLKIEIDNTDAEGRVILCDALTEACAERPDLLVDFATLTGAARVAVGTEIACMFCNEDTLAEKLADISKAEDDPLWRLPLHQPYKSLIETKFADLANSASSGYAGAITAALYLQAFVDSAVPWIHYDVMAWNVRHRPGRPEGGEAMGLRATYELIKQRYR